MGKAFDTFIKQGGKVLMLGGSGLKEEEDTFAFSVPFSYKGKSPYDKDYFELAEDGVEDILSSPILCYTSAHMVEGDGEVYAFVREPYFSRTYGKYCSHYNTPYRIERAVYPGAIQKGNILYVSHELAGMYAKYGVTYHRRYFKWLLRKLYHMDSAEVSMPSQGRIHFVKREEQRQYVLHLMYASPVQRGGVSVLEDFPVLRDTEVKIHVPEKIENVLLIPQNEKLSFETGEDGCTFVVPKITGHQMVVLNYSKF